MCKRDSVRRPQRGGRSAARGEKEAGTGQDTYRNLEKPIGYYRFPEAKKRRAQRSPGGKRGGHGPEYLPKPIETYMVP